MDKEFQVLQDEIIKELKLMRINKKTYKNIIDSAYEEVIKKQPAK